MRNYITAAFAVLVVLQQAINPVHIPLAATAQAASAPVSTKSSYQVALNTNTKKALELHDTRPTFDTAVLAPLKAAQEAKAKADAEAAAQAPATSVAVAKPAIVQPVGDVKQIAYAMVCAKWGCDQWNYVDYIVGRESGWNPNALNASSGACGLFQALPCSKMGGMEIQNQLNWGLGYIAGRYGTPAGAYAFWQSHHWY